MVRSIQKSTLQIIPVASDKTKTTMQMTEHHAPTDGSELLADYAKSPSLPEVLFQKPFDAQKNGTFESGTMTHWHRSAVKQRHPESRKFNQADMVYFFYPPRLLNLLGISRGMEIVIRRSTVGWQYSLRDFRVVPENAPIFEFCRDGNLSAVRTLFMSGHASPWDRDPTGRTPLWVRI